MSWVSVDGSFQKRVKTRSRVVPAQLFCAGFLCIIVWTDSGRRLLLVIAVVKHESLSLQPHTASVSAAVMTTVWKLLLQRQMSDFQIYDYTFLAKNDFLNFIFVSFSLFVLAQAEEQQQNVLQRRRGQDKKYVDLKILDARRLLVTRNGICVMFVIFSSASLRELKKRLNLVL